MKLSELKNAIKNGCYAPAFCKIYGEDCDINLVTERYLEAAEEFISLYKDEISPDSEVGLFSVGGRSEITGNHTDHNCGEIIAASINLDIIAVAAKNGRNEITLKSKGFDTDTVALEDVSSVRKDELYKASAIIRGMCDGFLRNSYSVCGFCAYTTSNVLKGSGLSSSAAFEVMVGNILNHFANGGKVDNKEIAKIAQYAENVHFGKPCGLMDQMACAVGGFIYVDFEDKTNPVVEKFDFDISSKGYSLCIINTGGNHADLNDDYTSIPAEMKLIASFFGKEVLRQLSEEDILQNLSLLREKFSDRAIMRAIHFFEENKRVRSQRSALNNGDFDKFLQNERESSASSILKLQNIFTVKNISEQGISLALSLASHVLDGKEGCVYRVHGGGFAGTIQCFVPDIYVNELTEIMQQAFGDECMFVLKVRGPGAVMLDKEI